MVLGACVCWLSCSSMLRCTGCMYLCWVKEVSRVAVSVPVRLGSRPVGAHVSGYEVIVFGIRRRCEAVYGCMAGGVQTLGFVSLLCCSG